MSKRKAEYDIDPMFPDRWSPRAFHDIEVPTLMVKQILEAARWAPSARNEQPWRFVYAIEEADLKRFRNALMDLNQVWANEAPVLICLLSRKHYESNGRANQSSVFDAGAAWMALALQARKLGLYTHAMGGFDKEKALAAVGASGEEYDVLAMIAVGWKGDPEMLPERVREMEQPNLRKKVDEFCFEGRLGQGPSRA
jgi:nitroreductase